jgi:hypothetical protein
MATEAQIAANRANAKKSTGPKSPTGKAASSRNSRKHGLAGTTTAALVASESDREYLEKRKAACRPEFDPRGAEEEALFEVIVAETVRTERCRDAYFHHCREHGRRARTHWDADRRREADDLALTLGKAPHAVARQLERTLQGAELKLELWSGLAAALDRNAAWTDAQRSLALDLLGIHPDLRDGLTPVDPAEEDVPGARMDLVGAEIARLESLRDDVLIEDDAHERAAAESTLGAELTRPVQLMDRYERAAWSRARWAWRKLDDARESTSGAPMTKVAAAARRATTAAATFLAKSAPPVAPARPAPARPAPATPAPAPAPARAVEPARPMNRRQRRALAAQARRAAG